MRYACMMRAVNVSGSKKITMKELAELCRELGFTDVVTYLQSGNIVLNSDLAQVRVELLIQDAISETFGHSDVDVLAWSAAALGAAIAAIPDTWQGYDPATLHFSFLKHAATTDPILGSERFLPDEFFVGEQVVYVHCPNGYGRTRLTNNFFERHLGTRATTRNWNTANKLHELALIAR